MKKINIKKPSSFVLKAKSPKAYKNEERKSHEIRKSLEHYTNDWLEGRISDKDYKALKNDLYKRQEKIINTNYMKTYSVLVTEEELRLFSEFLEQKEFGFKSASLGLVSAGSWNAKEAAKYAYEDDPEGYDKKKRKYAFRGFLAPAAASYQLERALYLKEQGKTPEEIRKDIEGRKTSWVAYGVDGFMGGLSQPLMRGGASKIHGLVHKLGTDDRDEVKEKINNKREQIRKDRKKDKKKEEDKKKK